MNCWEYKKCNNHINCPAYRFTLVDGFMGGKNAGMACVFIPHTLCNENTLGNYKNKLLHCQKCDFYVKFLNESDKELFIKYIIENESNSIDAIRAAINNIDILAKTDSASVQNESNKGKPDINKIANLLKQDVAISMQIYKLANVGHYRLNECKSLTDAIESSDLTELQELILPCLLDVPETFHDANYKYSEHSLAVGKIAAYIARTVGCVSEELAYMTGLFHDSAVPYLLRRFRNYSNMVELSLSNDPKCIDEEERGFNTNHCVSGHLICKSLMLPDIVCDVIKNHHCNDMSFYEDLQTRQLAACLYIAECISFSQVSVLQDYECSHDKIEDCSKVLCELGMCMDDIKDLCNDAIKK